MEMRCVLIARQLQMRMPQIMRLYADLAQPLACRLSHPVVFLTLNAFELYKLLYQRRESSRYG